MSRRLDIELTSRTPEGAYTWRAAGARQPKGLVDADLVPGRHQFGRQLRGHGDARAKQEERGVHAARPQFVQKERRRHLIGPVVEGQCDVIGVAPAG